MNSCNFPKLIITMYKKKNYDSSSVVIQFSVVIMKSVVCEIIFDATFQQRILRVMCKRKIEKSFKIN